MNPRAERVSSEAGAAEWINTRRRRQHVRVGALASTPDGHGFVVADDEGGAVGSTSRPVGARRSSTAPVRSSRRSGSAPMASASP